jgi:hypothetical protein
MKKIVVAVAIFVTFIMVLSIGAVAAANGNGNGNGNGGGFDQYGYNYQAHLFNGWYGYYYRTTEYGTLNAWLVMKWSTNWIPMGNEPVGAWVTNHWSWYSTDMSASDWYGFLGPEGYPSMVWTDQNQVPAGALYYVTEFMKIQAVGDNPAAWATYEANGAYSAGWGTYPDGVPMFVVFQDVVSIYNLSGTLLETVYVASGPGMGLGQPIF